ncbi:RagB/SusD family nutrient uptake outer membrane protein [Chitinophaga sp. sic0106]|uniref:RagB/SusD family nutrient uptake outer membrane protein n=1 Tax=Chitinophaga sp. sic0106 TaxID=2854785 RepID=UPI001C488426|nr:RagB/SusD family nutrient uptake outer membrane protein [Chitinophaga sp. sic0106]MBV7533027.1 RagB/SusD family nutrient uptake outer membrane protein [Chitinophaga sp. sic0106]
MRIFSIPVVCMLLAATLLSSCEKFLGVRPDTNKVDLYKASDLAEILNNSNLGEPNFLLADLISDEVMIPEKLVKEVNPNSYFSRGYLWAPTVWDLADTDPMYGNAYKWILQMNIVLTYVDQATGDTAGQKMILGAQAKINRAYYYFQLLNLYGPAYQASSATSDLAVPMILAPDASLKPARATVQVVYEQIKKDLQEAANTAALPDFGQDLLHPGKAAAYALLAKTYLYASDYGAALEAANKALAIRSTLVDYNTWDFWSSVNPLAGIINKPLVLKDFTSNPEVLMAKVCIDLNYFSLFKATPFMSDDLQSLFHAKDLRLLYGFYKIGTNTRYSYLPYGTNGMQFNYTTGVPEMMLIKAECLARNNDGSGAVALLNTLRQKRFKPADYTAIAYTNNADALKSVLDERRRELCLHGGIRLSDLKRLNQEDRFKTELKRISDVSGNVLATLPAGSPRYLLPFEPKIISNNPLIIQNAR